MSATATLILDAVSAAVSAADPGVPVLVRQRPADPTAEPGCGWKPGDPTPCWVVSMARSDEVDRFGTFEHRSVDYAVTMSYVRQFIREGGIDDDPVVRQKKALIRNTLYTVGLGSLSAVWGAPEWREGVPYQQGAGGNTLLQVSDQTGTFHAFEART